MSKELADYVTEQLKMRQWSKRELGRQARISLTSVLRATDPDPDSDASFEVLTAIAKALRIRPETLFVKAGLFAREPNQTTQERHLLNTFRQLPAEHQRSLIQFCDYLFTVRSELFPAYDAEKQVTSGR